MAKGYQGSACKCCGHAAYSGYAVCMVYGAGKSFVSAWILHIQDPWNHMCRYAGGGDKGKHEKGKMMTGHKTEQGTA